MERLTFTATGTYARSIPTELIDGLLYEIVLLRAEFREEIEGLEK